MVSSWGTVASRSAWKMPSGSSEEMLCPRMWKARIRASILNWSLTAALLVLPPATATVVLATESMPGGDVYPLPPFSKTT
jgi:hypothetical protein